MTEATGERTGGRERANRKPKESLRKARELVFCGAARMFRSVESHEPPRVTLLRAAGPRSSR